MNDADLRAENERLTTLNDGLSRQVLAMGMRLEAGRRELLAAGWDAACDEAEQQFLIGGNGEAKLKAENPYRKPVMDLSGAMICKTDGDT